MLLRRRENLMKQTSFTVKVDAHTQNRYKRCTFTAMQKSWAFVVVVAFAAIFVIMSSSTATAATVTSIGNFSLPLLLKLSFA